MVATQTGLEDHFQLEKVVPRTGFGCQIWSCWDQFCQDQTIFGNQKWSSGTIFGSPGDDFCVGSRIHEDDFHVGGLNWSGHSVHMS